MPLRLQLHSGTFTFPIPRDGELMSHNLDINNSEKITISTSGMTVNVDYVYFGSQFSQALPFSGCIREDLEYAFVKDADDGDPLEFDIPELRLQMCELVSAGYMKVKTMYNLKALLESGIHDNQIHAKNIIEKQTESLIKKLQEDG